MCLDFPCSGLLGALLALGAGYLLGKGQQVHLTGLPHTLQEEEAVCPGVVPPLVVAASDKTVGLYQRHFATRTFGEPGDFFFHPSWAGDYMVAFYVGAVQIAMPLYTSRQSEYIQVPTKVGNTQSFRVGHIIAPNTDMDDPYFMPIEKFIPRFLWNLFFLPGFNCFMSSMRKFPFEDNVDNDENNTWAPLLQGGKYKRKRDWVMSFYEPYKLFDGKPIYPPEENNLAAFFFKHDEWDDGLERAIAFDLIGAHRVKATDREFGGEKLAFVLPLNRYKVLAIRPGFGNYGGDLYFNAEGLPVMLETPDGRQVQRGDKDWQYWKFVCRSSLVSGITLVDHLHLTHFRAANILSRVTRKALPPDHLFRRFMSIFTFGSIYINNVALHTLLGPNHVLHRSTPFQEFESLSSLVPTLMPALPEWHRPILNKTLFDALPAKIKEAPYYADGILLVEALRKLIMNFFDISHAEACAEDDSPRNPDLLRFRNILMSQDAEAGYATLVDASLKCLEMREQLLAFLWTVTGWHRHVGTVGDYYKDPDLAGFSWKEGEAFVRPKQCMLMTVVASFTSLPQPKLNEDFSHLFKGLAKEEEINKVLESFRKELGKIEEIIAQRNKQRQIQNFHAHPGFVECSVAA